MKVMCDSFPAISAEQLTKAVNLAAAGTLSALDAGEEDPLSVKDLKNGSHSNGSSKEPVAVSKSSIQLLESLSASVSRKAPVAISRTDIAPSTSFYGRARKISTKKKAKENPLAPLNEKKYSGRKNYKLAPPLIPNRVRHTLKNLGTPLLMDNNQVVKINQTIHHPLSTNIRGPSIASSIKPITFIHSPQSPQPQHSAKKSHSDSSMCVSPIFGSNPSVLTIQTSSIDSTLQKAQTDVIARKPIITNSPPSHFSPSPPGQGEETTTSVSATISPLDMDHKNKAKITQFVPHSPKSDPVFRVPFPVTFTQTPTTSINTVQLVRLAAAPNVLSLNVSNNLNSSSPLSAVSATSQSPNQMTLAKEKPKMVTAIIKSSPPVVMCKTSISSSKSCMSTSQQGMLNSYSSHAFNSLSSVSKNVTHASVVSVPKCLTSSMTVSPSSGRCGNLSNEKVAVSSLCKKPPVISIPDCVASTSFTHQTTSPSLKVDNLSSSVKSPLNFPHNTTRYINIRPSLTISNNTKLSTVATNSNVKVHPVFIITSTSNNITPHQTTKCQPTQSTPGNSGIVILPPMISPVLTNPPTNQSFITICKAHNALDVQNIVTEPNLDVSGSKQSCSTSKSKIQTILSNSNVFTISQSFPCSSHLQMSPSVSNTLVRCQSSPIPSPSCQSLNSSPLPSPSLPKIARVSNNIQTTSIKSATGTMPSCIPNSPPVLINTQTGSKYCVSFSHPVTLSSLDGNRNNNRVTPLSSPSPSMTVRPVSMMTRMPLTVVKDPFMTRNGPQQGTVRMAVYPLPRGFKLPENESSTKISTTTASTTNEPVTASNNSNGDTNHLARLLSQDIKYVNTNTPSNIPTPSSETATTKNQTNVLPPGITSNPPKPASGIVKGNQVSESMPTPNATDPKLVISPAGIHQLQSLLRKMGTSEGYFIISTPRSSVGGQQKASAMMLQNKMVKTTPSSVDIHTETVSDVMSCPYSPSISTSLCQSTMTTCAVSTSTLVCSNSSSVSSLSSCVSGVVADSRDVNDSASTTPKQSGDTEESLNAIHYNGKKPWDVISGKEETINALPVERMMSDTEMEGGDEEEDSDDDSSSSADSSCSSNALVIETNDQVIDSLNSSNIDKDMDIVNKDISTSPSPKAATTSDVLNCLVKKPTGDNSDQCLTSSSINLDSNLSSPLSLSEIVRQHHFRYGGEFQPLYSPPFTNYKELTVSAPETTSSQILKGDAVCSLTHNVENSEIRFSIPESPSASSSYLSRNSHHQHGLQNDNHPMYDHSLNTPHSMYTHHDLVSEVHMHNSSDIEAAINLQRLSECTPAPPPPLSSGNPTPFQNPTNTNLSSNSADHHSPKSPLSVNSSQQMEPHTPLHPPMTPNTMLINLLNRVPTPLLTNHQDLLSVPSSQENENHFQHANPHLESSTNKTDQTMQGLENDSKEMDSSGDILFNATSHHRMADNSESFEHAQNALDLIASNYLPSGTKGIDNAGSHQIPVFSNSIVSSQNLTLFSRSWDHGIFTHCNNSVTGMTFPNHEYNLSHFDGNDAHNPLDQDHEKTDHSVGGGGHCKSCSIPITITINLDTNTVSLSNAVSISKENNSITEPHHDLPPQNFPDQHPHHHELPQQQQEQQQLQQCILFDGITTLTNPVQEKCQDAEIIRHLIMNTGNHQNQQMFTEASSVIHFDANQPLQNCHFEDGDQNSYLPNHDVASNVHCNTSEDSSSQFNTANFSQRIPMSDTLSQEDCHNTFNNLNNSDSLMYENTSSYENVRMDVGENMDNCTFDCNSSTSMDTYSTSSNSVFDSSHNNVVFSNSHNSTNPSYIMPRSLSDIQTSFDANSHSEKSQLSLHPQVIQSDGKMTQSSEFTSDIEHNNLFFHQSSTSESHTSNLHLYDMGSLHDSPHDIGYPISRMDSHDGQIKNVHQECLQSSHCSDMQARLLPNQCNLQNGEKQLQEHPFDFSLQENHPFPGSSMAQNNPDVSVSFSNHQPDLGGFMNESFPSHFYTNSSSVSNQLPIFSQQCAVGSEAPLIDTNNSTLHCPLSPYKNATSGLQMEYHYQPQDASDVVEKHPVLPSASFSPPSVADPAATPDPGPMDMYSGSFQNLSAYDTYLRGGQSESRAQLLGESSPESGNFCVECNTMYKTQCKFHPTDCMDVSDAPILSHARLTLPPCLKLAPTTVVGHTNNTGIFAKETIAVRTKFGPLIGSAVSCDKMGSTRSFSLWQTFVGSNVKVMDTSDENSSNWLMFVKPARMSSEQNLVAFQHGNRVFFVTRTEVKVGQELLYWFSKDYARMLGISSKPKNAQHELCPHCPVCKQVFADRKQVRSHIRLQHPKPQVNKCTYCSKSFSQVSHLKAHVMAVHLHVKKFVCDHCGKRFGDSSNLRKHVKSHSDERNFKCQICSKAFIQKAHLQVHMNSHMPVKHEQCRYCGNRFTRTFERKQHELQHTKQNRIECQHCSKVFYKQKVYKEHQKIHRNERNFPCSHCGKAFRNKTALTRHESTCKQHKRGLSLVPANTHTNTILSRHLVGASSSHTNPVVGNPTEFTSGTDEDASLMSSAVSSSGLSADV